jgi:hypothetical protein
MSTAPANQNSSSTALSSDAWVDARRLEGWAGEARVNLIRVAALLVFYGHHLLNVYVFQDDPSLRGRFHFSVSALALSWSVMAFVVFYCLARRWAPPALKYVATAWDLGLITLLLAEGDGPRSPLLVLYFLVIVAAALRLSLPLVYLATLGSVLSYLLLLGGYAWYQIGWEEYYSNSAVRIPRPTQVIVVLALGTAGFLAGQLVRQAHRLVRGYPVRIASPRED